MHRESFEDIKKQGDLVGLFVALFECDFVVLRCHRLLDWGMGASVMIYIAGCGAIHIITLLCQLFEVYLSIYNS